MNETTHNSNMNTITTNILDTIGQIAKNLNKSKHVLRYVGEDTHTVNTLLKQHIKDIQDIHTDSKELSEKLKKSADQSNELTKIHKQQDKTKKLLKKINDKLITGDNNNVDLPLAMIQNMRDRQGYATFKDKDYQESSSNEQNKLLTEQLLKYLPDDSKLEK